MDFSAEHESKKAITRTIAAVIIIVVLVIGATAVAFAASRSTTSNTSSGSSTSSVSSASTSNAPSTLTIDDAWYPSYGLNDLIPSFSFPDYAFLDVYQTLLNYNATAEFDNQGYQLLPGLATSWNSSNNGLTYTLNLRHGVTFTNGDPFNAYQVWAEIYGIYHMIFNYSMLGGSTLGTIAGVNASLSLINTTNVVFGSAQISELQASGLASPTGAALAMMTNSSWPIYVTNPYQIVVNLIHPYGDFMQVFAGQFLEQYDAQYVLDHGGFPLYGTPQFGAYETTVMPGTGPYSIANFSVNAYISFAQNPTYWGKNLTAAQIAGNPYIAPGGVKNVVVDYKPDDLSRYTDLSDGAAQISMIESQDWPLVVNNPQEYAYTSLPKSANLLFDLSLNTVEYPTNVTDVRLAIVHAINYTQLYNEVLPNDLTPFFGPETPGFGQYYDVGNYSQYSYNVTLAQQYLKAANIANLPAIEFLIPSEYTSVTLVAQFVQQELATNLGITVNIQQVSYDQWEAAYNQGYSYNVAHPNATAQMTLVGAVTFGDSEELPIDNWVFTFSTAQADTGSWWIPNGLDNLLQAFVNGSSTATVLKLEGQMEQQIYDQAPIVWLGIPKLMVVDGSLAYKTSVIKGYYIDPCWTGPDEAPIFNTVTFTGGPASAESHATAGTASAPVILVPNQVRFFLPEARQANSRYVE